LREPEGHLAEQHYQATHTHHSKFPEWWKTSPLDLADLGAGLVLYLHLVRGLALTFSAMTVFFLVNIVINSLGNEYSSDANMERTMLGNFGSVATVGLECESENLGSCMPVVYSNRTMDMAGEAVDKEEVIVAEAIMDVLGLLPLVVFLVWMYRKQDAIVADVDANSVTVDDYTVLVKGLPKIASDTSLLQHMERFGQVVEVQLGRDVGNMLNLTMRRGALAKRIESQLAKQHQASEKGNNRAVSAAEARSKVLVSEVRDINKQVREMIAHAGEAEAAMAFVTFREEQAYMACLQSKPQFWYERLFADKSVKFEGKLLKFAPAPPPSDILWENLGVSRKNQMFRSCLAWMCFIVLLVISFALITVVTSMQSSLQQVDDATCAASQCEYDYQANPPEITSIQARNTYYFCFTDKFWSGEPAADATELTCTTQLSDCYACYCFKLIQGGDLFGKEQTYCKPYTSGYTIELGLGVLSTVLVVAINFALKSVATRLVELEKHHNTSSFQSSTMEKLFVAQFINTAMVAVIVNARWPWITDQLEGTPLDGNAFIGQYTDIDSTWYQDVGSSIVVTMMVSPVFKRAMVLYQYFAIKWARFSADKSALTQHELNAAYMGPEFLLAERYGELLNAVFVTLTFCSGMPILVPLAALNLISQYFADKYELLRQSREPPRYQTNLADAALRHLVGAPVVHLCFASWMFTFFYAARDEPLDSLFGAQLRLLLTIIGGLPDPIGNLFGALDVDTAKSRLLQRNGAPVVFVLFLLIWALVLSVVYKLGSKRLKALAGGSNQVAVELEGCPPLDIAIRTGRLYGMSSYCIRENQKYAAAFIVPEFNEIDDVSAPKVSGLEDRDEEHTQGEDGVQNMQRQDWGDDMYS